MNAFSCHYISMICFIVPLAKILMDIRAKEVFFLLESLGIGQLAAFGCCNGLCEVVYF